MNSEFKKVDQLGVLRAEHDRLRSQLQGVKNSFSYRLGNMLVEAVYRPGRNTILLPYRLMRLGVAGLNRRKELAPKLLAEPELPQGKLTQVKLEDLTLSSAVSMIKRQYVQSLGVAKDRLGGYHETDWRRIEYISSLLPEAKSVLDVGIGTGAFLNLLLALNRFEAVVGLDVRRHSKFSMLFESQLYQIMYASVTNLPLADKCIDVVICMEVLEHLDKQAFLKALPELRRVANQLLVLTVPYNEPEPRPSYHKLRFTDSDLLTYFPHGEFILLKKSTGNAWVAIVERS